MTTPTARPPLRFLPLLAWCAFTYYVVLGLREDLLGTNTRNVFEPFETLYGATIQFTVYVSFFGYAFGAYLLLYNLYPVLREWWWSMVLPFAGFIVACIFMRAFLEEFVVFHIFDKHNYNPDMSWGAYLLDNLYYAMVFTPVGVIYYFSESNQFNERLRRETEVLQRETELKFLRSQVNPHFLFNTLNNLYSLVATGSTQALPALDKLSGLLRYSLYEDDRLVPLPREITCLKDLLYLEGLRVADLAPPVVNFGPFTRAWQLPPLLLVPFVENACKHGELRDPRQPLSVSLTETEEWLSFRVENAVCDSVKSTDKVGGIGLPNVRKRLQLVYPDRHQLTVTATDTTFLIELLIK